MSIEIALVLVAELIVLYLLTRRERIKQSKMLVAQKIDNKVPEYAKWPHGNSNSNRR